MTQENQLEKETSKQVSTMDKVLHYLPGSFLNKNWNERVPTYMSADNFTITYFCAFAGVAFAALSFSHGTPDFSRWGDKESEKEAIQSYQKHQKAALDNFYNHAGKDSTMSAKEFTKLYQKMENPEYEDWKDLKDTYKSGKE